MSIKEGSFGLFNRLCFVTNYYSGCPFGQFPVTCPKDLCRGRKCPGKQRFLYFSYFVTTWLFCTYLYSCCIKDNQHSDCKISKIKVSCQFYVYDLRSCVL